MGAVWRLTLGISALASLWIPSGADAQNASALVLEKSGATTPEVQPYSEIAVGATVSLSSGAKLVFLHYQTCRTVTVVGGKVAFASYTYTISKPRRQVAPERRTSFVTSIASRTKSPRLDRAACETRSSSGFPSRRSPASSATASLAP